jgi:23S rRNA pseudouridine2605 synthase
MRINKFVAQATGLSRRGADQAITEGRVSINEHIASLGDTVSDTDSVALDGRTITPAVNTVTIMLNKPVGYVSSREGQGSKTIYDLLPAEYHALKPVGRLDKDSSGLLLLTNDGDLANQLTHPRYAKEKVYEIELNRPLSQENLTRLNRGVELEDGTSHLRVATKGNGYEVRMSEGRNRQIRRTFDALGYTVTKLHRIRFGQHELGELNLNDFTIVDK